MGERLDREEFVKKAIVSLRKESFKGIHSVYSGFNDAFKKYYNGENPIDATNKLAKDGKIVLKPVKGGMMIYLPDNVPAAGRSAEETLKKMGL